MVIPGQAGPHGRVKRSSTRSRAKSRANRAKSSKAGPHRPQFRRSSSAERSGKPADHAGHRVHRLAGEAGEHVLAESAHARHLRGQFRLLAGQADHVAHRRIAVGTEEKVRRGEKEEVEELVRGCGRAPGRVHGAGGRPAAVRPPKQPSTARTAARWCIHGQMPQIRLTMLRQLLGRPADDELFKSAQAE